MNDRMMSSPAESAVASRTGAPPREVAPARVLIVEDAECERELIASAIEEEACFPVRAADGADALRILSCEPIDVVLLDLDTPDVAGASVLSELARRGVLDAVPVIVVGTHEAREARIDALRAGAIDFLTKPLRQEEVAAKLRAWTQLKRLRDASTAEGPASLQLSDVLASVPDFVCKVGRDGIITFINRTLPQHSMRDVIGTPWERFVAPQQHEVVRATLEHVLATGEAASYESTFEVEDGEPLSFANHVGPLRVGNDIVGVVIVARDVTERKHAEEILVAADRMAAVGSLAAGMAHEINNPLAAVIANLDLALHEVTELAKRHHVSGDLIEELRDCRDGANRIHGIVRDLKVFTRPDEDRSGPVDPRSIFESTLRMAWNEIRHRARLVKLYGDVPPVEANESRLGQVLLNLVVNAAQAIPEGCSSANEIRISTYMGAEDLVVFEISDTGAGISPEARPHLFEPFFTTKGAGVGTGLGLAICQRIVTAHGGRIDVESEPGKGSCFRVSLPRARPREPVVPDATPPEIARRRGRVLVIDDEPGIGVVVRRTLASEHDVIATTSADDALNLLSAGERYDVILCDLMMPALSGAEFYEELTRRSPEESERVVFLTGGAFTPMARAFVERVQNPTITKPFVPSQLRALVNERMR